MKKYWTTIMITAAAVLVIATFYVYTAFASDDRPSFAIQKKSGDASLIEGIVIDGRFSQGPINRTLKITPTKTTYNDERPFVDRYFGEDMNFGGRLSIQNHQKQQLIEEHRAFMRGKSGRIQSFYEDQNVLAYVDVSHQSTDPSTKSFYFTISTLDKQKTKITSYDVSVSNPAGTNYIVVEDVQWRNDQWHIITKNGVDGEQEIHHYTIDPAAEKMQSDQTVISAEENNNRDVSIELVNESEPIQRHETLVFKIRTFAADTKSTTSTQGDHVAERQEQVQQTYVQYNLASKQKENMAPPKKLKDAVSVETLAGDHLYFSNRSKKGIKVTGYDLANEKKANKVKVQLPNSDKVKRPPRVFIKNQQLYLLASSLNANTAASLKVVDIKSGDLLYKGEVIEKKGANDAEPYEMWLSFRQM